MYINTNIIFLIYENKLFYLDFKFTYNIFLLIRNGMKLTSIILKQ